MLITTSKNADAKTRALASKLGSFLVQAKYISRGERCLEKMSALASALGERHLLSLAKCGGGICLQKYRLKEGEWQWEQEGMLIKKIVFPKNCKGTGIENIEVEAKTARQKKVASFLGLKSAYAKDLFEEKKKILVAGTAKEARISLGKEDAVAIEYEWVMLWK